MRIRTVPNLSRLEAFRCRENEWIELPATSCLWQVNGGRFAVTIVHRSQTTLAPRRNLFEVADQQVVTGTRLVDKNYTLLLFCLEDGELVSLGPPSTIPGEQSLPPIKGWIDKVQDQLATIFPTEVVDVGLDLDEEIEIEPDQSVGIFTRHDGWLVIRSGRLQPGKLAAWELSVSDSPIWLPVGHGWWFHVIEPAELELVTPDNIPSQIVHEGLERMLAALFVLEEERNQQQQAANIQFRRERSMRENQRMNCALHNLLARQPQDAATSAAKTQLETVLAVIGQHERIPFQFPPGTDASHSLESQLQLIAAASGTRVRRVQLPDHWAKLDFGHLLGFERETQQPVALIRHNKFVFSEYQCYRGFETPATDTDWNSRVSTMGAFSSESQDLDLDDYAYTFVRPIQYPGERGFLRFVGNLIWYSRLELFWMCALSLLGLGIGLLLPVASKIIIDEVIPNADTQQLGLLALVFLVITVLSASFDYCRAICLIRFATSMTVKLQQAVMDKVLRLKTKFFRDFGSGDLQNRTMILTEIGNSLNHSAMSLVLTSFFSIIYVILCYVYAPQLTWIAGLTVVAFMVTSLTQGIVSQKLTIEVEEMGGKLFGFSNQLATGVSKLRIAGAEKRAFQAWCRMFSPMSVRLRKLLLVSDIGNLVSPILSQISLVVLLATAISLISSDQPASTKLTVGAFFAFFAAYQQLIGGAQKFATTGIDLLQVVFKRRLVKPILDAPIELSEMQTDAGTLTGGIELRNISFGYEEEGTLVLDQLNLSVLPGEFVAIVGPSGAGKSTLIRLLLGFETPQSGSILIDGRDLAGIKLDSFRRQVGVVLQQNSVPAGNLFEIISGHCQLTLKQAWQIAQEVGLAEDIENMPMQMHTVIRHGAPSFSGGQRQRMMIARALATNPKILLFDEATSALDNRTQQIVTESLNRRHVTRIVVAHRFSTIRDADVIYVIDGGKVVQSGRFDELNAVPGLFRELAQSQSSSAIEN